jgi:dTDP-glucose 4,6-dehydratase
MNFEPRNLLITGGAGFIGTNFVRHWLASTMSGRLVVLDALTYAGNADNLQGLERDPRFVFVTGDICDEALVLNLLERFLVDTIVHFAAESHVDRSILGPDDFIRTNVVGTHTLLKAAKKFWIDQKRVSTHRFHHVSTDEVYGSLSPSQAPFHEGSNYFPNSPYSASKAGSDHLVRAYHETYGLDTTVTNCSNNYGPYQFPEKLIPLTCINVLLGKPVPIYGDGLQVRDWLHVSDHCAAVELAIRRGKSGEVYNVGGNCETSNIHIVRSLCNIIDDRWRQNARLQAIFPESCAAAGKDSVDTITHVRDRPGHDRRYAIDFSKASRELGYAPRRDLTSGIESTIDWYLANVGWWQRLLGPDYASWIERNYRS